jgi:hypothetical protein
MALGLQLSQQFNVGRTELPVLTNSESAIPNDTKPHTRSIAKWQATSLAAYRHQALTTIQNL